MSDSMIVWKKLLMKCLRIEGNEDKSSNYKYGRINI